MNQGLATKIAELVAIGASMAANCQSCLRYHYEAAKKAGATEAEISAAIDIGRMIKAKPDEHIQKLVNRLIPNQQPGEQKENDSSHGCALPGG